MHDFAEGLLAEVGDTVVRVVRDQVAVAGIRATDRHVFDAADKDAAGIGVRHQTRLIGADEVAADRVKTVPASDRKDGGARRTAQVEPLNRRTIRVGEELEDPAGAAVAVDDDVVDRSIGDRFRAHGFVARLRRAIDDHRIIDPWQVGHEGDDVRAHARDGEGDRVEPALCVGAADRLAQRARSRISGGGHRQAAGGCGDGRTRELGRIAVGVGRRGENVVAGSDASDERDGRGLGARSSTAAGVVACGVFIKAQVGHALQTVRIGDEELDPQRIAGIDRRRVDGVADLEVATVDGRCAGEDWKVLELVVARVGVA